MLVDAGLAFPSDGMHGVNVVMPDTSYLQANIHRFRGMIVTHGHEDHIGGIAHHLKKFNIHFFKVGVQAPHPYSFCP